MTVEPELFPTWEDALAECEATAAHAEALLRNRGHEPIRPLPPGRSLAELTANLSAPPPELAHRAQTLHARHQKLQNELARAMRDLVHQSQLVSDGGTTSRKPIYIDRKF